MIPNNYPMMALNLICFALVLSPLTQAEIEPENIVGIWLFDQGAGKVAQDSSDNGIDGELKGGVKWVNGKFGKALLFPGIDQNFVEVPHDDSLNLTSFSFTLWLKIEATGNYQATFIKTANGLLENYSGYTMLPERLPDQTQLLPNYPNPFNPETWIPFELSQDSAVSVTIYDTAGRLVRHLDLGFQQAGSYVSQSRAIYWDGRTDTGERVASGIYRYQIQVGDYTDIRKMVILK